MNHFVKALIVKQRVQHLPLIMILFALGTRIARIHGLSGALAFSTTRWSSTMGSTKLFVTNASFETTGTPLENKDEKFSIPKVLLKRNRQSKNFRDGSQLVFSGSVAKVSKSVKLGEIVQVEVSADDIKHSKGNNNDDRSYSHNAQPQLVGWGVYNPDSMYRVRILCHSLMHPEMAKEIQCAMSQEPILKQILKMNFHRSVQTRRALGLPSTLTDTFRLVNGEGDSLSGLAVDIIGDKVAVVMSSAAWCEIHKPTIMQTLQEILQNHQLIWKTTPSRLKQDGYDIHVGEDSTYDNSSKDDPMISVENGIKYQAFPYQKGQKTSVYCDQRENRLSLAQFCSEKNVLDLCCYHGGFSLNAAKQGARSVTGVDSSEDAIETCKTNAGLNNFNSRINFVQSDISKYMQTCQEKFQVVVLDPPKLAPSASALAKATRKYHSLNRDALKLIDDSGGLFMTCTCSAAMTQKDGGEFFLEMVHQASIAAKREISLLKVSGAAPCHTQSPISFPAGNYLTAALFMVHPKNM
jgi:23S rRNA G2069 N7-methylase RlmK/C1962 C5-methylase RlmI